MAVNKNALIRYKTIDKCLRNRFRKWTLNDLIEACSDALYDYEGKDTNVSKRTIQLDIQNMRSDKLGYNAPIVVVDRKYYTYEEEDYSIMNLPISDQDLTKLNEAVHFLSQFKGFSHFNELNSMVQKLQDQVYAQTTNKTPIIDFEKNDNLKGLEFLDGLYQAVLNKRSIFVTYKSFKARHEDTFIYHAYMLKEFNNRWFVIGKRQGRAGIMNLALDRIIEIKPCDKPYVKEPNFNASTYFKHAIGVSVAPNNTGEEIELYVTQKHAPYVETKPFHWSQKTIARDYYGIVISLQVQHNFELEKKILGLGEGIRVIKPHGLKRNIQDRLYGALDLYKSDLNESSLKNVYKKLNHKGYFILNYLYTQREIKRLKRYLHHYFQERVYTETDDVLNEMKGLSKMMLNRNLYYTLDRLNLDNWVAKSTFKSVKNRVLKPGDWTEFKSDGLYRIFIFLDDVDDKQHSLQLIRGSQKKSHGQEEIEIITENSLPNTPPVFSGGILIMHPNLLYRWSPKLNQKRISWFQFDVAPKKAGALESPLSQQEENKI